MPRRDPHTFSIPSLQPGIDDVTTAKRSGRRTTSIRMAFPASKLVILLLILVAQAKTGATAARLTTTTRSSAAAALTTGYVAPPPPSLFFRPAGRSLLREMPVDDTSSISSLYSVSSSHGLPSPIPPINDDNDDQYQDDDSSGIEIRGGMIANWRKSTPLRPCYGCTPGAPMAFSNLFSECSFVTLGAQMGVAPIFTNLTLKTNDTVLVHLVGSRFFFPEASELFSFLTSTLGGTCPEGNRLQNLTSVCTLGGQAAPVGSDGPALCTIYSVNATKVHGFGKEGVGEGREEVHVQAHGLYGPGEYRFNFQDFNNVGFPYAFWVLQYLNIEAPGEGRRENTANVTVSGQFNNQPPRVPPARLWTVTFVVALVVFVVFAAIFNPWVGPRAIDLGARIPLVRRNVLEERQTGPTVLPPSSASVSSLQGRRSTLMAMGHGSGSSGMGGSGRGFDLRSMASSEDYQLMGKSTSRHPLTR